VEPASKLSFNKAKLGADFYLTNSRVLMVPVSILGNGDAASFAGNMHAFQGDTTVCNVFKKNGGIFFKLDSNYSYIFRQKKIPALLSPNFDKI
jgi:hypothetical protein